MTRPDLPFVARPTAADHGEVFPSLGEASWWDGGRGGVGEGIESVTRFTKMSNLEGTDSF